MYYGLIVLGSLGLLNKLTTIIYPQGSFEKEAGFFNIIINEYFGSGVAAASSLVFQAGALWLFLGLAIKYNWLHIREKVSKRTILIALAVYAALLVMPLATESLGNFGNNDAFTAKDEFKRSQECAAYRQEAISQTAYNFPSANFDLNEIFYSPVLSTCVYIIVSELDASNWITVHYYDVLTGNSLYSSRSTLGVPLYDKDGKEMKYMDFRLNDARKDFLTAALKTNSKTDFKQQVQNFMKVDGSEIYMLSSLEEPVKKWFE